MNFKIEDYETRPVGRNPYFIRLMKKYPIRQFQFPFTIWFFDPTDNSDECEQFVCDFADVAAWAQEKGFIEDFDLSTPSGEVTLPVNTEVYWNPGADDWRERESGGGTMDFHDFLIDVLTIRELEDFLNQKLEKAATIAA